MKGIKMIPDPGSFTDCFRKIFPQLQPLYWLGDEASFRFSELAGDEDWDATLGKYTRGPIANMEERMHRIQSPAHASGAAAILFSPGFLPKHADLVSRSTTLIGFTRRPEALMAMIEKGNESHNPDWPRVVAEQAELYVSAIDGVIWVLFARDEDVITTIRATFGKGSPGRCPFPLIPNLEAFLRSGSV